MGARAATDASQTPGICPVQAANALSKQKVEDEAIDSLEGFQESLLSELQLAGAEVGHVVYSAWGCTKGNGYGHDGILLHLGMWTLGMVMRDRAAMAYWKGP